MTPFPSLKHPSPFSTLLYSARIASACLKITMHLNSNGCMLIYGVPNLTIQNVSYLIVWCKHLRAKQNADRLHGWTLVVRDEQSLVEEARYPV